MGRRFTVTHGNFPNPRAIERAQRMGVAFDCQPAWLHLDGAAIKDVFGPARMRDFLPLRSLFQAGVVVAGGSDHMIRFDSRQAINPYNPFFGMWMAVTRQTTDGAVTSGEKVTDFEGIAVHCSSGDSLPGGLCGPAHGGKADTLPDEPAATRATTRSSAASTPTRSSISRAAFRCPARADTTASTISRRSSTTSTTSRTR